MMDLNEISFFHNMDMRYAYDKLTGVLNRETILSYVDHLIENNERFTYGLCDVDNFKSINDFHGHMIGDEVLKRLTKEICEIVGDKGIVGRYGGDEFIIVLPNINEYDVVWDIFHSINVRVNHIKFEEALGLSVTVTSGISRYPIDALTYADLMQTADKALYRGKSKGRNCFIIYLAAKHAGIEIKDNKSNLYSSMEMLTRLFDYITISEKFPESVYNILRFLSTNLEINSVAIESDEFMCENYINPSVDPTNFPFIPPKLFEKEMNSFGLSYVNSRKTLLQSHIDELYNHLKTTDVHSICSVKIQVKEKYFGVLVARHINNRIWQTNEMDLFIVAAKLIAQSLYYRNTTLEEEYKEKSSSK